VKRVSPCVCGGIIDFLPFIVNILSFQYVGTAGGMGRLKEDLGFYHEE